MVDTIELEVVTPTRLVAQAQAKDVIAPGVEGEFGVLPGHTVFISLIKPGEVRFTENDKIRYFAVGRGFAEVGPTKVVILTDDAEESSTLKPEEILAAVRQDQDRLGTISNADPERAVIEARIERNRARLAVANRR